MLHQELAGYNNRAMGAADCRKAQTETDVNPNSWSQPITVVAEGNQALVGKEVQKLLDKGTIKAVTPCHNVAAGLLGICNQSGEISADTVAINSLPRLSDQFQGDEDNVDRKESGSDGGNMEKWPEKTVPLSPGIDYTDRENDSHSSCHLSGPAVVPIIAASEESDLTKVSIL